MIHRFIKKVVLLISLTLIILSFFLYIYRHQINKLKLNDSTNIIICGDSHTQSSVNDSVLKHSINISQSAEPYLYTYNVIKLLTNGNPQINKIILGFSFHSLSELYDGVISKEEYILENYPKYLSILDLRSFSLLMEKNISGVIKTMPNVLKNMLDPLLSGPSEITSYPFIGHFRKSRNSNINDSTINSAIIRHYMKDYGEQGFSSTQEKYLKEIVQYCNDKQIKIILLNTPVSKEYYNKIPDKFVRKYHQIAEELNQNVLIFDFHDLEFSRECYGDGDHINETGAEIFTAKLDSLIHPVNSITP